MNKDMIRQIFLDFFEEKGHKIVKSSPVVPVDDPTLLFANAGMNQFKDIFLGKKKSTVKRAASTQKCIRVSGKHNDLEEVGRDGYHHTFFEMLGNWSFGDYFKEEAIVWAWELLTERYHIDKERLYVTVFGGDSEDNLPEDNEAYAIWRDIVPEDRILYGSKKDNFWEMGDTGPCGPCSEIHMDIRPDDQRRDIPGRELVNKDHPLVIEIWNLVFMEFFRQDDGSLIGLPMKSIDTGMGFERLCSIIQGTVGNNYHTDVFMPLITRLSELSGIDFKPGDNSTPFYVISDHIRTLTFAIADGAMPANEGRGYVLRRLLRRAARFLRQLDVTEPMLYKLSATVIDVMGGSFPELRDKAQFIATVIKSEEERFSETLDTGLKYFTKIAETSTGRIEGRDIFRLYDTYGFPVDLTALLAEEMDLSIDKAGFERELELQRERARQGADFKGSMSLGPDQDWIELKDTPDSVFTGYERPDELKSESHITRYRMIDENHIAVVLDKTPFYAESGGQLGDHGSIDGTGYHIDVTDTVKQGDDYVHIGRLKGRIEGSLVSVCVEDTRRMDIMRNHTATHLLHSALRGIIGDHAVQSGSYVGPERLRFDYAHFEKPTEAQLLEIEMAVNKRILENIPVQTEQDDYEKALEKGVTALFGEKYDDKVRVVRIGEISAELCGGTHVGRTGDIGCFIIVHEESVGSGTRRIEAVTGRYAMEVIQMHKRQIFKATELLKTKDIAEKISDLMSENRELSHRIATMEKEKDLRKIEDLKPTDINGILYVAENIPFSNQKDMSEAADKILSDIKSGVVFLISAFDNGKVGIVVSVSGDLSGKIIHAGKLIKDAAGIVGGGGGGRPDFAQAGGKDPSKIGDALAFAREYIAKKLGEL